MSMRTRVLTRTAVLVALTSALCWPVGSGAVVHPAGTAQAAQAGKPLGTIDDIAKAFRADRFRLPTGEIRLPKLPRPLSDDPAAIRAWAKRGKALALGKRLETEPWTCDTAAFLGRLEKIDGVSMLIVKEYAKRVYDVSDRQASGLVRQAAGLGRSWIRKLVNASCT
jgi:hypothetical protein